MTTSDATTAGHKQAAFIFYLCSMQHDDGSRAADSGKENSDLFGSLPFFYDAYVLMIDMENHIMVEAHHWRTFLLMPSMAEFPFYKRIWNSSEK